MNITTDNSITSVNGVYESNGVTNTASNGVNKVNSDDTAAILTLSRNGDSDGVVNVKRTSSVSNASSNMSYAAIVNTQNALRALGFYNGGNYGYLSPETLKAINNFCRANNLRECETLTKEVYDSIMKKYGEIKDKLSTLGFYDGKENHLTKSIKNFQKLYGLIESGKCDSNTNTMLTKVHSDYTKLYNSTSMGTISKVFNHDEDQKDAFVKVFVFLKNGMGLNTHQIAGVMGNLHAESAILPDNVYNGKYSGEHDYKSGYVFDANDKIAFGLLQWANPARKAGLEAMAETMALGSSKSDKTKAIWDINVQLAYFKQEMTSTVNEVKDYSAVWKRIKNINNYNDVSDIFLKEIESPGNANSEIETRRRYSKMIYDELSKLEENW